MWFSSNRPDRPRRRASHATAVAYVALLVAVLGIPATAVATGALVHTRDIANGAVTNPKLANHSVGNAKLRTDSVDNANIRNGSVGFAKLKANSVGTGMLRDGAVIGAKVANNSLTGAQINESTLNITGIVDRVSGSGPVTVGNSEVNQVVYPLKQGNPYQQPAHTADLYFGTFEVRFPAGCTGERWAAVDLFIRGIGVVGGGTATDQGNGQQTTETGVFDTSFNFAETSGQRTLRAELFGGCGADGELLPQVLSLTIHVGRIQ